MKGPDIGYPHVRAQQPSGGPARPGSSQNPPRPRRCAGTAPLGRAQRITFKGGNFVKQANYYEQDRMKPQAIPSATSLQVGKRTDHVKSQTIKEKCTSCSVQPNLLSVEHFNSSASPTKPSETSKSHKSSIRSNHLPHPLHSAISSPLNCSSFRDVLSCCQVPLWLRVCVAMIALLLLLAGDVERNPGPTVVTQDRVPELAALLDEVAAMWYLVLTQLGVSEGKLDQIQAESAGQPSMLQYCLTRGLYLWARSDESPTCEKIIAVFNGRYLPNRPLARKVEEFAQTIKADSTDGSRAEGSLASHTPAVHLEPSSASSAVSTRESTSEACVVDPTPSKAQSRGVKRFFKRIAKPFKRKRSKHPEAEPQVKQVSTPAASFTTHTMHNIKVSSSHESKSHSLTIEPKAAVSLSGQILPLPSCHQQWLPHASTTGDVIAGYADQMRDYYRTTIPQCSFLTYPPPPTRKVFNLFMISHDQYNYGRGNDELVRLLQYGNVDDLIAKKSSVKLEDLFHLDEDDHKVVLVEGAPGAGKSTLAWHICQKWGTGKLFQEFKLVVFVQLHDPAIQSAKSLADILPALPLDSQLHMEEVVSQIKRSKGNSVLFVLDGWDEFSPGFYGNKFFKDLIHTPATVGMPSSTLLITSRPIASGVLHKHASSRVETIGFKHTELQLYFKEALKEDSKIRELEDCLQRRPVIKANCYLPLNAVIIVHLFLSLGNCLPRTLHGVFLHLVIHCIVRQIMKQQADDSGPPRISSLNDLPPDMQTQLSHICAMAYHGVIKNKVTFSEEDLMLFKLPTNIPTLGLIQVVESFVPNKSRFYNFLHLSVQELLAAYHISTLPPEEQVKIFKQLFGQARFAAVFQYYAAFTKLQPKGIRDIILIATQQRNQGRLLTFLHCLYEAQDSSLCQFVASQLNGQLNLSKNSLSLVDYIAVGYFLHQCATICPMTATLAKCSLDSYKLELLAKELKRPTQAAEFETHIDLSSNNVNGNLTQFIASELIDSTSEDDSSTVISKLDLSDNLIQNGDDGLSHLCQALTTNTSLIALNLSNCELEITEKNGPALSHMLMTNKTLKSLEISPIVNTNGRGVRYLSEGISSSSAISRLDISRNSIQIEEDGLSHLCQALTTNTSLVELDLSHCQLHAPCGPALRCMLETNKTLTSLTLFGNQLPDSNVNGIAEGLRSKHRTLKYLDLKYCGIHDAGMKSLADSLMVNDSLEELNLRKNYISPEAARCLSDMLKHNSTLKKLNMSACELINDAVKPLASALEVNSTLEELNIGDNPGLTDPALVALGESLKTNTGLKTLSVELPRLYASETTPSSWRQFVQCLKLNHSLELLITGQDKFNVEDVNTVRRKNSFPALEHI